MTRRKSIPRGPFGKHQLAMLAAIAGAPLLRKLERARIREEKGPRSGLLGAWVTWSKNRVWVPAASLRRLAKRGLYRRGRLTIAARRAKAVRPPPFH